MTAGGLVTEVEAWRVDGAAAAPVCPAPAPRPARRARPTALGAPAAAAACGALLLWLAFDSGGYFAPTYQWAGAAAFAALGILCVVELPRVRPSAHALCAFAALAALAAWTGLSATWSPAPAEAALDLQRALLYVGLFGLAVLAAGHGRHARVLVWGVLAVLGVVAAAGLAGHDDGRLDAPLGYWNAMGGVGAAGLVLGTALAADARSPLVLRPLAAAAAVAGGQVTWLSLSRGSIVAAAAGVLVLAALFPRRGALITTTLLIGAALAAAIVLDTPLPIAAAALAQAAVARVPGDGLHHPARALGLVALAGAVALALAADARVAEGTADASRWLDDQWQEFLAPTTAPGPGGAARLTTARGTRSDLYRVAVDGFEAHPLRGDGAGGFEVRWYREREVDEQVRDAHSLELQTLGELGAVGAALLLAFLVSLVLAMARARRRAVALGRGQAAAVAATFAVWLVHSAVDWDWQVPAFTGAVLVLAAAALPAGRARKAAA